MNDGNFILNIQATYNQLTKAEKKVADYVLNNQKEVLFMTITDLADTCKVGDTSVYRFCRTMGLSGYQEFKMRLSLNLSELKEDDTENGEFDAKDDFMVLAKKIKEKHTKAIGETFKLVDPQIYIQVIEMFEKARQIFFMGVGDSLQTALDARNKFIRITNKVRCITDTHIQAMTAAMLGPGDLVVIISYSGSTKDNIQVAKISKEAGANLICITRYIKSPLTAYADLALLCGANEGPLQGGSIANKISQLYIIDLLYSEYYRRNHEAGKKNKEKTSKAVVEKLF